MPSTTIYSATSDGRILSSGEFAYSAARNGEEGLAVDSAASSLNVGQQFVDEFFVYEAFLNFDVSSLSGSTIDSATLSLWLVVDASTTDFTIEARARNWGDTLESGDWVAGGSLSGLTLLASISTSGIGATGAYKPLTSEAALLTAIATAAAGDGILRLMLCSSRTTGNNEPTGNEFVTVSSADETGTTQDPKLDITYSVGGHPAMRRIGRRPIGLQGVLIN